MTPAMEFDHPNYPAGHALCRQVQLYRLAAPSPLSVTGAS